MFLEIIDADIIKSNSSYLLSDMKIIIPFYLHYKHSWISAVNQTKCK